MTPSNTKKSLPIAALAAAFLLVSHSTAQAYIDPGTGGMLLQLLLGGVAGSLVIVKLYWFRFREALRRLFGTRTKTEKADTE